MPENESTTNAMSVHVADENGAPVGYCPHCDYRIDPGICPECGEAVEASRIRAGPRAVRRRKWIQRCVLLAVVIGLTIGGRSFYRSNVWRAWVPTSFLIAQQPSDGWTQDELMSRLKAGTLSSEEIAEFFDAAFPIELVVQSPHPLEIAPTVTRALRGSRDRRQTAWRRLNAIRHVSPAKLTVDGNVLSEYAFGGISGPVFMDWSAVPQTLDKSELPVGIHMIEISGDVSYDVKSKWNGPSLPGFPITRPYFASAKLEIIDRPLRSFVDGKFDEALAGKVVGSIRIVVIHHDDGDEFTIFVKNAGPPVQIVGNMELRNAEDQRLLGRTRINIPMSGGTVAYQLMTAPIASEGATPTKINVEFVPDLERAFVSGSSSCFAGRLHWHDVEVVNSPLSYLDFGHYENGLNDHNLCRPPDSVSEWHPDDE